MKLQTLQKSNCTKPGAPTPSASPLQLPLLVEMPDAVMFIPSHGLLPSTVRLWVSLSPGPPDPSPLLTVGWRS